MYKQATEKAASVCLDLPRELPGPARKRKLPEKFVYNGAVENGKKPNRGTWSCEAALPIL